MSISGEQGASRDTQKHEAWHKACNERYWQARSLIAEEAAAHFFHCTDCAEGICAEGVYYVHTLRLFGVKI